MFGFLFFSFKFWALIDEFYCFAYRGCLIYLKSSCI